MLAYTQAGVRPSSAGKHTWAALFSLADKLVYDFGAALALDIAAPVELAVAALNYLGLVLIVTAAAAHQLAPIHAFRGLVAKAPHRSQGARALVLQAVVWTGLDVHQVVAGGSIEIAELLHQLSTRVELHGCRAVVLFLQRVAHLAEVSQLQPAGLQTAGAGHPVALAGHVGKVGHSLKEGREKK